MTISGHAVTMITFAPTLDSEQARLLLAYYGIRYRERDHLMPFVLLPAWLHSGDTEVPRGLRQGRQGREAAAARRTL